MHWTSAPRPGLGLRPCESSMGEPDLQADLSGSLWLQACVMLVVTDAQAVSDFSALQAV